MPLSPSVRGVMEMGDKTHKSSPEGALEGVYGVFGLFQHRADKPQIFRVRCNIVFK